MKLKYVIPFLLISFTGGEFSIDTSESIRYDIVKKNKILGYIDLQRIKSNETTKILISSEVNTKLLFNFRATSKETYIYEKDILIYSSIYRTLNNHIKVDRSLKLEEGTYHLTDKKITELPDLEVIRCNLVTLFFDQPPNIKKVFCDKLNRHVTIIKLKPNVYKVIFPNKDYNLFHYRDGKCELIEAIGSFYTVSLIPRRRR